MSGWRVWQAFEVRPGVTTASLRDDGDLFRSLSSTCRKADRKIDAADYGMWLDLLIEHSHLWGQA